MKVLVIATFLVFLGSCHQRMAGEGVGDSFVIYGSDDRYPMEEKSLYFDNSRATAVKLPVETIYPLPPELYVEKKVLISWNTFDQVVDPEADSWYKKPIALCPEERFKGAGPAAGTCSGVLIAPDLILTAGHCILSEADCLRSNWAFDYRQENSIAAFGLSFEGSKANPETIIMLPEDQIYSCQKILARQYSDEDDRLDFALIQLDGYVHDRKPQPIQTGGNLDSTQILALLGYPMGLPGQITLDATVVDNTSEVFFLTNTDSYVGNSGSAVIDMSSKLLEGILVDGDEDFVYDADRNCMKSRVLAMGQGQERVTRIQAILDYIRDHADYGDQLVDYILNLSAGQN